LVNVGYEALLAHLSLPPNYRVWNRIWDTNSLPKVNMFCWTLTHVKILTGENLQK